MGLQWQVVLPAVTVNVVIQTHLLCSIPSNFSLTKGYNIHEDDMVPVYHNTAVTCSDGEMLHRHAGVLPCWCITMPLNHHAAESPDNLLLSLFSQMIRGCG